MTVTHRHLTTIGFDADDTLWQNEQFFQLTQDRFVTLLADFAGPEAVSERLLDAERRNVGHYGYGIKGFTLSMIETAIEISDGSVSSGVIGEILGAGRELLRHPVETLPHVRQTLAELSAGYRLILVTKGDLFDQERKLAESDLGDFFDGVEIVSDKTVETYRTAFTRHGDGPDAGMMVGNSLKSDILPAIAAGSWGIHVPHRLTWALEHAEEPRNEPRYRSIEDLSQLPGLLADLA